MADSLRAEGFAGDWQRLRRLTARQQARALLRELAGRFAENDLLTYASAISYQALFALVPLALAGLALLGFIGLAEVWESDVAPQVSERVSPAAFIVIDSTVERILTERRGFWLTFGLAFAIWQVSGAVRAVMGVLGRIYGIEETRSFRRRYGVSLLLAIVVSLLLGLAVASIQLGPAAADRLPGGMVVDVLAFLVRWGVAVLAILVAVGILLRYAPARRRRSAWTGFGAVLVMVLWIAASLGFGLYASSIADYGSVFGSLATVIVLMTYLYISALVFLGGAQVDSLIHDAAESRR